MLILYIVLIHTFLHATTEKQHIQLCTKNLSVTLLFFVLYISWSIKINATTIANICSILCSKLKLIQDGMMNKYKYKEIYMT